MLKPLFLSTKSVPVTLYRAAKGSYVNGVWTSGAITQIVVQANIQPVRYRDTLLLPEADRTRQAIRIYSSDELREQVEGKWDADEFDYNGFRYVIMKVQYYGMGTLNHYKAIAYMKELVDA